MTTTQAHAHGYGAYWDGHSATCMIGILESNALAVWRKGFAEARRESAAMLQCEAVRMGYGNDPHGNTQSETQ